MGSTVAGLVLLVVVPVLTLSGDSIADAEASVLCLGRRASVVLGGRGGDRLVGGRQLLDVFRGGPATIS
jgi:hypothetical protein